ncbi:MAG: PQQ-binding-like beta-propeller repeat protein [Bryobacteraceae bacterium]
MILAIGCVLPALLAQNGDWPMYSHDPAGTRYSPLTQITPSNVANLKLAWKYRFRSEKEMTEPLVGFAFSQVTPIVVSGVMYLPSGKRVVALEPETGKEIWSYELTSGSPSARGVSYWPGDRTNPPRIIFTAGKRMLALNAKTGKVDPGFGKEGEVDLVVPYNSPPTIFKNLVFVGANVPEQPATGKPGDTRAYDARTGAPVWDFHSVPRPGEAGHNTWPEDGWKDRTGVNNWGFYMTVDAERGLLYTTFGSPASDYYGFDRKGDDLYGNSLVALDANTGKVKWFFQAVHHDIWDFDLPPAPVLVDLTVNGKKIPAWCKPARSDICTFSIAKPESRSSASRKRRWRKAPFRARPRHPRSRFRSNPRPSDDIALMRPT